MQQKAEKWLSAKREAAAAERHSTIVQESPKPAAFSAAALGFIKGVPASFGRTALSASGECIALVREPG